MLTTGDRCISTFGNLMSHLDNVLSVERCVCVCVCVCMCVRGKLGIQILCMPVVVGVEGTAAVIAFIMSET